MLAQLVGNVDSASAAVLIALAVAIGVVLVVLMLRPSKMVVKQNFELEKARLQNNRDERAVQLANSRDIEMKKVERGLTTLPRNSSYEE